MDRFAVFEKDHPKVAARHLGNLNPAANAAIGLYHFFDRCPDRSFDPLVLDRGTVGARPQSFEVPRGFHRSRFCCSLTTELSGRPR